jgi:ABC-type antimicrobial peptide transport system permease subunit
MKIVVQYLKTAWYNILHNKGYAIFCVVGTVLTFVFVVLLLQFVYMFASNYPPMSNADRIIRLKSFQDTEGKDIGGIKYTEVNVFIEKLENFDCISFYHNNLINVIVNGHLYSTMIGFVNASFWKMYDFDFHYGRPFTKEECSSRRPLAVITESMSQAYFNTKNGIGQKITFQGNEYEIVGVVKNISLISTPTEMCTVWVSYVFDKFIPNETYTYTTDVLVPPSMSIDESKERISRSVQHFFENKTIKVNISPQKIKTLTEENAVANGMFQYGAAVAIFLFLLIPSVNILSLGNANTNNRAEEIAIRRAFGASRLFSFLQIMTENLLLVIIGSVIGLMLAVPTLNLVIHFLMKDSFMENITLVNRVDYPVIFAGALPVLLIFSLLSGGVSAYLISRCNIAHVLKGGAK